MASVCMHMAILGEGSMRYLLQETCAYRCQRAVVARPISLSALEETPPANGETAKRRACVHLPDPTLDFFWRGRRACQSREGWRKESNTATAALRHTR